MATREQRNSSFLLFLLGLGSATKVFFLGTIAFSELVIFPIAPFLFLKRFYRMKRERILVFFYMLGLMVLGMFISSWWNRTPFPFVLKQFAIFYGYFAYFVVFYCLLHDNLKGIGWFALGAFISGIITIWAFNPTAQVSSGGFAYIANTDAEAVVSGPLFWIGKVRGLSQLPIVAMYLKTPVAYSISMPILFVAFALFHSVSGRGQSMAVLIGGVMMLIGRKSRRLMQNIGRHILMFLIAGIMVLFCYKVVYSYAASEGYLGEEARNKYIVQTDRGTGVLSLLIAGRTEFFIALSAIVDHPIIGFGPRAEDRAGYAERFLLRYGTQKDIEGYLYYKSHYLSQGMVTAIPAHSHIMASWLWCGITGLVFFLWVLYTVYRHIRYYSGAVPHWFGYFALTLPGMVWSIFFNPFGARWGIALPMVCLLFARAIGQGRMVLPYDMELEARRYD